MAALHQFTPTDRSAFADQNHIFDGCGVQRGLTPLAQSIGIGVQAAPHLPPWSPMEQEHELRYAVASGGLL